MPQHMALPVAPPVAPMLAKLARELPHGDYLYEPKWDGFRCMAFRDGDDVDLRSRNERPFTRYFPEVAEALRNIAETRVVIDGEVLVVTQGRANFEALMTRLHPAASRAALLARSTPASYVAFDLLAVGDRDLRAAPFAERRHHLEQVLDGAPAGVAVTPVTDDPDVAQQWLTQATGGGIDGVVVKARDLPYQPGKRAMIKVKPERTADCVVAGARIFSEPDRVASLVLGLYDDEGVLRHIGVASSFTQRRRLELLAEIAPYATPLEGHPWEHGFGTERGPLARLGGAATRWSPKLPLDWLPLRPELVCEVAYEHVEGTQLRHPARFRRWRPDRDAPSCRVEQLQGGGSGGVVLP